MNIPTMNGGYREFVNDGIMYRLIETDGIEMFADRGLYLAVSSSRFYDNEAFHCDEATGEIRVNPEYDGVNALFELPLDPAKADPVRAEAYLRQLLNPQNADHAPDAAEKELAVTEPDLEATVAKGTLIPESVRIMRFDENGMGIYEYGNYFIEIALDAVFEEGQTGFSRMTSVFGDEHGRFAVRFCTGCRRCRYRHDVQIGLIGIRKAAAIYRRRIMLQGIPQLPANQIYDFLGLDDFRMCSQLKKEIGNVGNLVPVHIHFDIAMIFIRNLDMGFQPGLADTSAHSFPGQFCIEIYRVPGFQRCQVFQPAVKPDAGIVLLFNDFQFKNTVQTENSDFVTA